MPPRYAYWTILIDKKPTAFRARLREELLPTANQLKRTNADVAMMWFARGRLWESPEQERDAWQRRRADAAAGAGRPGAGRPGSAEGKGQGEKRGRDWRPGGKHEDPRARFDKKRKEARQRHDAGARAPGPRADRPRAAGAGKFAGRPPGKRPWGKPPDGQLRPEGQRRPHGPRPPHAPRDARGPGGPGSRGTSQRPDARGHQSDRPRGGGGGGKFAGPPQGKRPWGKPPRNARDARGERPDRRDRPPRPPVSPGTAATSTTPDTQMPRRPGGGPPEAPPAANPPSGGPKPPDRG